MSSGGLRRRISWLRLLRLLLTSCAGEESLEYLREGWWRWRWTRRRSASCSRAWEWVRGGRWLLRGGSVGTTCGRRRTACGDMHMGYTSCRLAEQTAYEVLCEGLELRIGRSSCASPLCIAASRGRRGRTEDGDLWCLPVRVLVLALSLSLRCLPREWQYNGNVKMRSAYVLSTIQPNGRSAKRNCHGHIESEDAIWRRQILVCIVGGLCASSWRRRRRRRMRSVNVNVRMGVRKVRKWRSSRLSGWYRSLRARWSVEKVDNKEVIIGIIICEVIMQFRRYGWRSLLSIRRSCVCGLRLSCLLLRLLASATRHRPHRPHWTRDVCQAVWVDVEST